MLSHVFSLDAIGYHDNVFDGVFQMLLDSERMRPRIVAHQYPNPETKALRRR